MRLGGDEEWTFFEVNELIKNFFFKPKKLMLKIAFIMNFNEIRAETLTSPLYTFIIIKTTFCVIRDLTVSLHT